MSPSAYRVIDYEWFDVKDYGASPLLADNAPAFQRAIAACVAAGGGIVYIPQGTYIVTGCCGVQDANNVTIKGAGIGATIIDSSATIEPTAFLTGWGVQGVISIGTTKYSATPIENCWIEDLTLKCSMLTQPAPLSPIRIHPIFFAGFTKSCGCRRVKIDGSRYEAIYLFQSHNDLSTRWTIEDCELTNCCFSGINGNDQMMTDFLVTHNYCHDFLDKPSGIWGPGAGIIMVGASGIISDNIIKNVLSTAIIVVNDGSGEQIQNILIDSNIIVGVGGIPSTERMGIEAHTKPTVHDGRITISNNTISNIVTGSVGNMAGGIYAGGAVVVRGNHIGGCSGMGNAWGIVVYDKHANLADVSHPTQRTIVENNVIENVLSADADRFQSGIYIYPNALGPQKVIVRGNIVEQYAIKSTGYAFYDDGNGTGNLSLPYDNLFDGPILYNATTYNTDGSLNDTFVNLMTPKAQNPSLLVPLHPLPPVPVLLPTVAPTLDTYVNNMQLVLRDYGLVRLGTAYIAKAISIDPTNLIGGWDLSDPGGPGLSDVSLQGRDGLAVLSPTFGVAGIGDGGTGIALNGTTQYLKFDDAGLCADFDGDTGSLSLWAINNVWADGFQHTLLGLSNVGASKQIKIFNGPTANRLYAQHGPDSFFVAASPVGWTHYGLTWSAGTLEMYVNGVSVGTVAINPWSNGMLALWVGYYGTYTNGSVAPLFLWKSARSAPDMASLATP